MSDTPDVDVTLIPRSRQAVLPLPQPAALIYYTDGIYEGAHPDTGISSAGTLREICAEFEYYVFDESVYALGTRTGDALMLKERNGQGSFIYFPRTVERMLARVAGDYFDAKERYLAWLDNKDDLATAWEFVSEHPAFWMISKGFNQPTLPITSVQSCHNETSVSVENGPVIAANETTDPFVTGDGDTFEEALVDHARLVDQRYNWDGESRPSDSSQEGWDE